jgi:hypothetical protein
MPAAYWSTLELNVGIICACLPALRQLFIQLGAKVLATTRAGTSAARSTGTRSTLASSGLAAEKQQGQQQQQGPRRGDEGDFIPLVDVEIGTGARPDENQLRRDANKIRATTQIHNTTAEISDDSSDDLHLAYARR